MVKYTQTIRLLLPANCLFMLDHFVWSAIKRLTQKDIEAILGT